MAGQSIRGYPARFTCRYYANAECSFAGFSQVMQNLLSPTEVDGQGFSFGFCRDSRRAFV